MQVRHKLLGDTSKAQRLLVLLGHAQTRDTSKHGHTPSQSSVSPPAPETLGAFQSISTWFQRLGRGCRHALELFGFFKPSDDDMHGLQSPLACWGVFKKATAQFTNIAVLLHTWQDPTSAGSNTEINDWRVQGLQHEGHASGKGACDPLTAEQLRSMLETAR